MGTLLFAHWRVLWVKPPLGGCICTGRPRRLRLRASAKGIQSPWIPIHVLSGSFVFFGGEHDIPICIIAVGYKPGALAGEAGFPYQGKKRKDHEIRRNPLAPVGILWYPFTR